MTQWARSLPTDRPVSRTGADPGAPAGRRDLRSAATCRCGIRHGGDRRPRVPPRRLDLRARASRSSSAAIPARRSRRCARPPACSRTRIAVSSARRSRTSPWRPRSRATLRAAARDEHAARAASPSFDGIFGVDIARAEAWVHASQGDLASAAQLVDRAAKVAADQQQPAFEAMALARPCPLRPVSRRWQTRLEQLTEAVDGPLVRAMATYARGLADDDAGLLDEAARGFGAVNADLFGAEAGFAAARIHRRSGRRASAFAALEQAESPRRSVRRGPHRGIALGRSTRGSHRQGARDRRARRPQRVEPGDRRTSRHQHPNGRQPARPRVRQARHLEPSRAACASCPREW